MPPLEAMASGCVVVTTDSFGINTYAQHMVNCLKTPVGDVGALAAAVVSVLTDRSLHKQLQSGGLRTAVQYTWENAVSLLEDALYRTSTKAQCTTSGNACSFEASSGDLPPIIDLGQVDGQENKEEEESVFVPPSQPITTPEELRCVCIFQLHAFVCVCVCASVCMRARVSTCV